MKVTFFLFALCRSKRQYSFLINGIKTTQRNRCDCRVQSEPFKYNLKFKYLPITTYRFFLPSQKKNDELRDLSIFNKGGIQSYNVVITLHEFQSPIGTYLLDMNIEQLAAYSRKTISKANIL